MTDAAMIIRDATDADLDAALAIHNDAILNSAAIWLDEPVERAEREAWLAEHESAGYPVIVADVGGVVAGYASFGPYRPRWGYRFSVENSVYLASEFQGRGFGRALMVEIIARAKAAGMHAMMAGIEASNEPSLRLHESLGFERVAFMPEVGTKFGRWLDLVVLELRLDR
jgi:phosphinothricin acetyltransferase